MNSNSTARTDGDDNITNKRKRSDGNVGALGEQFGDMLLGEAATKNTNDASLSTLPDSVLLHIVSFVLGRDEAYSHLADSYQQQPHYYPASFGEAYQRLDAARIGARLKQQRALEKTCRRFSTLLGKDSTMSLLYPNLEEYLEFDYQVDTLREKLFIANGVIMNRLYQKSAVNQINLYLGGADGVRRVVDDMLTKMEQSWDGRLVYANGDFIELGILRPPQFPENGFTLFLRGDSIAYLTEVVEQHMVHRLNNAWFAARFRSMPASSHPYPMLCERDVLFVDSIRASNCDSFDSCVICRQPQSHCCSRLSFCDSPKIWNWPDDNCLGEDILGAEQRQYMVRAIASRAGIIKLTSAVFDSIVEEILHYMAIIVIDAFEASKSLWCPCANVGTLGLDNLVAVGESVVIDDEMIGEEDYDAASAHSYLESDYITNHPPPPGTLDEEGRHVCVIVPRQIKDAAVRIGMKPLLDSQSWEVSEGRTKKEEVNEAIALYGLSLDDDSSSEAGSDGGSVWKPNCAEEASNDHDLEEW
mmetsp:Transcript_1740/g.3703  ORF Transcript_1740/g.3703 Transcript_1740/m.3703 type:complete len:529 (+) Transcript_1740:73-1659(+)